MFFAVILPILALIIKLDSPGSVFYAQERVGLNRRRGRDGFGGSDRRKVVQPGRPVPHLQSCAAWAGTPRRTGPSGPPPATCA